MARIFVIIWQLTTIQICPKFITILPQWVQNFAKTPNSPSKVCQRFLKVCPSGEISPNLDTLMATYLMLSESFEEPTCVWFRLPSLALLSSFIRLGTIVRFDLLPESFIQFAAKNFVRHRVSNPRQAAQAVTFEAVTKDYSFRLSGRNDCLFGLKSWTFQLPVSTLTTGQTK